MFCMAMRVVMASMFVFSMIVGVFVLTRVLSVFSMAMRGVMFAMIVTINFYLVFLPRLDLFLANGKIALLKDCVSLKHAQGR